MNAGHPFVLNLMGPVEPVKQYLSVTIENLPGCHLKFFINRSQCFTKVSQCYYPLFINGETKSQGGR